MPKGVVNECSEISKKWTTFSKVLFNQLFNNRRQKRKTTYSSTEMVFLNANHFQLKTFKLTRGKREKKSIHSYHLSVSQPAYLCVLSLS
ncbi:hypothetical protein T01_12099 [Trichinella spiralis]|uniref:PiggyBac transposable element-derived protein domain-containing protein n=1 Tax=Trichinella spiralis TaxID=6334 RepID=A0A0V1BXX3_TRISP|nr:hypothetical protein T01_12099 [Trichinella spiralis]